MRQGFRPSLEPPQHRKAVIEARRPGLCLFVTSLVVLLVFTIFGVSAWNVYAHRFGKNTQYLHTYDEVSLSQINDDLSATFCDSYNVSVVGPRHVYLLPHLATVNTTAGDVIPVEMHQMPFRVLNVKAVYLLTGSAVNVTACLESGSSGPPAKVVFIRGDSNFERWRKNSGCNDCLLKHITVHDGEYCDNIHERNRARLYYKVEVNDQYFLVIYYGRPQLNHHQQQGPGAMLKGEILRTHFDISNAEKVCNDTSCHFDLPWMSHKDVVVKFESDGFHWNNFRNVTTQCQARVVFWVSLFGITPVVCVIPISLLFGWFLCRRTRRNAKALRQKQEKNKMRITVPHKKDRREIHVVAHSEDYGSVAIQDG